MNENENINTGDSEDLAAELEFKLTDMLSFTKLLANSTCPSVDFEINTDDVNKFALTMHDKLLAAIFVIQKLRISIENNIEKL